MKAIYRNPFNDSIFQVVEILSENDDRTTIITDNGLISLKTNRLISIPEFIAILEKEINNEMVNNTEK